MASSKNANTYNYHSWEQSEFPIICETCLGDNKNIRMTKERFGKECKICTRPFTVFRWQAGTKGRYKKTEVCQTCSRTKNVCQTCILDLDFNLPVEVRDTALKINQNLPRGYVNQEYAQQQLEEVMGKKDSLDMYGAIESSSFGKFSKKSDVLTKLARTEPYYKRNRPHICSFFVKGECKRGEECPFRHELPTDPDNPLSHQNIKDRYYGVNDPVAAKMMVKYNEAPRPSPPEDRSITTLHLGNVNPTVTENSIRSALYHYGEIRSVTVVSKQKCAFVQFATREGAEKAIAENYDRLIVCGTRLSMNWGRPQASVVNKDSIKGLSAMPSVPGLPHFSNFPPPIMWPAIPPPPPPLQHTASGFVMPPFPNFLINPPDLTGPSSSTAHSTVHYPSQDPNRLGGGLQ